MAHTFPDRRAAGRALADRLGPQTGAVVLALPRGGLPVADEVARALKAPLGIVLVRKIGLPGNPELAIGAIAGPEGQTMVLNDALIRGYGIDPATIEGQAAPERQELKRRSGLWGGQMAAGALKDRTVVLVDDGIATGATMRAAIAAVRADSPARIVVATPVAPPELVATMGLLADEVVCLHMPEDFIAVGRHYQDFPQLQDRDVTEILASAPQVRAI